MRPRSNHRGDVKLSADVVGSIGASVIRGGVNGGQEDTIELGDIREEAISALILNPVGAVGEGNNRDAVSVRIGDNRLTKAFRANTLLIISENDSVEAVIEGIVSEGEEPVKKNVGVGCIVVEIQPENLVILSNDANLGMSRVVSEN